jgi:hypothetical protein
MLLSLLAIVLPICVFAVGQFENVYYASTNNKFMLAGSAIMGVVIILCKTINIAFY